MMLQLHRGELALTEFLCVSTVGSRPSSFWVCVRHFSCALPEHRQCSRGSFSVGGNRRRHFCSLWRNSLSCPEGTLMVLNVSNVPLVLCSNPHPCRSWFELSCQFFQDTLMRAEYHYEQYIIIVLMIRWLNEHAYKNNVYSINLHN